VRSARGRFLVGESGYYGQLGLEAYGEIVMPRKASASLGLLGLKLRTRTLTDARGFVARAQDQEIALAA
jgi:hypothetical protein